MPAVQAVQAVQAANEIDIPLVCCNECCTIWLSTDCERCPRCACQIGKHWNATEEQTALLMYAVSLLDEEHIQRGAEYTTWEFGEILREHVPFYNETCRGGIQVCYEVLRKQPSNLKVAFAIGFFEQAFVDAPEDPMMYHFDEDELEYPVCSDEEEW